MSTRRHHWYLTITPPNGGLIAQPTDGTWEQIRQAIERLAPVVPPGSTWWMQWGT
jgi:hypothetical protein